MGEVGYCKMLEVVFPFSPIKSESLFHSDFSHDGKETKDLAPSKLPVHGLAHARRWGRPSRRSRWG